MKKVFSAILALVMVFSLFPAEVFAYAEEPAEENALGEILPPEDLDSPIVFDEEPEEGTIVLPSEEDGVIRPADETIPEDQTPEEDTEIEALPATDDITATSGSCGTGLTWSYSSSTGVLTIDGNGAMNDFGRLETDGITVTSQPWSAYSNSMTSVVFTGNVTKIGIAAFFDCQALKSITLPDSVTQIGEYAFHYCYGLTSIVIPQNVWEIKEETFSYCRGLTSVTLPEGLTSIGKRAFASDQKLKTLNIPSTVRSIGAGAFNACWVLTDITIPKGISTIEPYAFGNCRAITTIDVPDGVKNIADHAFYNCYSCKTLSLPDSLVSIGEYAFDSCKALSTVYYSGTEAEWNAISIGANNSPLLSATKYFAEVYTAGDEVLAKYEDRTGTLTIYGSGDMTDFKQVGSSTSSTAPWASLASKVKRVIIQDGVTSVGAYSFYYFKQLTEVSLPDSLTSIKAYAFGSTTLLTKITIPAGVTSISANAFYGPAREYTFKGSLAEWVQVSGHTSIGTSASSFFYFDNDPSRAWWHVGDSVFANLNAESGLLTVAGTGTMKSYSTSTVNGSKVTTAPWGSSANSVRSVAVESDVASIGSYAFAFCNSLESVTLADTVTAINSYAFSNDGALKTITFYGDPPKTFNAYCFTGVTASAYYPRGNSNWTTSVRKDYGGKITWVVGEPPITGSCGENLSWELTDLGVLTVSGTGTMSHYSDGTAPWAAYRDRINTVILRNGVTSVGNFAFSKLTAMQSLSLPQSLTEIGMQAFEDCSALGRLNLPSSLTSIGYYAFSRCNSLTELTLPDSLTLLDEGAFASCNGLETVTIPGSVKRIGDMAFNSCKKLKNLHMLEGVKAVGEYAFSGCSALTSVDFPVGFGGVADGGFQYSGLTKLNVTFSCGDMAFYGCPIRELSLSTSVYGYSTFGANNQLERVKLTKNVGYIQEGCFDNKYAGVVFFDGSASERNSVRIDGRNSWLNSAHWVYNWEGEPERLCGDQIHWDLTDDGTLIISGTGAMWDRSYSLFHNYTNEIRTVQIGEGVTRIGNYAFGGLWGDVQFPALTELSLPSSLTAIGNYAFYCATALQEVSFPAALESMGNQAFAGCSSLNSIRFPADPPSIGDSAFYYVTATAYYPEANINWSSLNMLQYGGTLTWTPESDVETVASGMFGETVTWTLKQDGTLILGGSGETEIDYTFRNTYSSQVKRVVIRAGVLRKGIISAYSSFTEYIVSDDDPNYSVLDGVLFSKDQSVLISCPVGKECDPYVVPDSVKEIADNAFYFVEVKSCFIPEGIERIGENAFWNIKAVSLPAGIYEVSSQAFRGNLNRIDFAGTSADFMRLYMAYHNWNGGMSPELVNCSNGRITKTGTPSNGRWFFTEEDGCVVIGTYPTGSGELSIERDTSGYDQYCYWGGTSLSTGIDSGQIKNVIVTDGVVSLGNNAFRKCYQLQSVSFPEGYESIGEYMFYDCALLRSITLPGSLKSIGRWAFHMSGLSSVNLNEGLESIGESAFGSCDNLTEIVIPESVSSMGYGVFQYSKNLKSIQMPQHMDSMGNDVFLHCEALESIRVPEGITTMPYHLFEQCKSLKNVELPVGMKNVSSVAFRGCVSLESITLPEGMESLDNACFESCTALREIHLPASIKSIDMNAFRYCSVFTDLYFAGGVRDWVLVEGFDAAQLKNVTIHFGDMGVDSGRCGDAMFWRLDEDGTLIIAGTGAMSDFSAENGLSSAPWASYLGQVKRLEVDAPVSAIGTNAFLGCNQMTEAQLPSTLIQIGASSFSGCSGLKKIHYADTKENWAKVQVASNNGYVNNAHVYCTDGMLVSFHSMKAHKKVEPSCTEDGLRAYYECTVCGECFADVAGTLPLTEEELVLPALGHDPSEAVEENRVDPGCTTEGGYDTVVYCSACQQELSREHTVLPAPGHTPAEAVEENRVEPGCTADGGYDTVVYCSVCREELSCEHTVLSALGHDPAAAVEENRIEPNCTEAGSYDLVVLCKACGEELSREQVTLPAIGHEWGEATYSWAEDNSSVTARRVCAHDESHVEEETVDTADSFIPIMEAECEEDGSGVYKVSFQNKAFEDQIRTVVIPALGHDWDQAAYQWTETNDKVTASRVCRRDAEHREEETVDTEHVVTLGADCETDGLEVYSAAFENPAFENQSKTLVLPALGHAWSEPEYTWAEDNSTVTACRICAHNEEHVEEETVQTADHFVVILQPECETEGRGKFSVPFENLAFRTQVKEVILAPLGHTPGETVIENRTEPDCTTDGGYDSVVYCTVCHEEISREHTVIPALAHTPGEPEILNRTEPDCTTDGGYDSVVYCTVCREEISREHVQIPAPGHSWGDASYTWSDDLTRVTAKHVCLRSSEHEESETVACQVDVVMAASCEQEGLANYTANFTNPAFEPQTRSDIVLPALGHDWGEPTYSWAGDDRTVTASRVCRSDASHAESETAVSAESIAAQPDPDKAGELRYEASFENPAFETQVKTYEIPALVQREDEGMPLFQVSSPRARAGETAEVSVNVANNPGIAAMTLRLFYDVDKLEFLGIADAGLTGWIADRSLVWTGMEDSDYNGEMLRLKFRVRESCEDGLAFITLGCSWNSVYNGDREAVSFLVSSGGVMVHSHVHAYGEPVWSWEDDLSAASATFTCLENDDTQTVNAAVLSDQTEPNCETEGSIVYTARVSFLDASYSDTRTVVLPALGHDWELPQYEWAEDLSLVSASRVCLRDPAHCETESVQPVAVQTKEASCEEPGETTYTAQFTNPAFADQSKTVRNIPALGHVPGETLRENAIEPTCTEEGGYDEVQYCSVCGKELNRSHVSIPVLGHDWGQPEWIWAEDYSTAVASFACLRDQSHTMLLSAEITSTSDALGITFLAVVEFEGKTYTDSRYQAIVHAGDLSGDGEVNALDLVVLRNLLLGQEEKTYASADVNGDGSVTILDLIRLKKYLAGQPVELY